MSDDNQQEQQNPQFVDNGDAEIFVVPFGNGAKYLKTIKINRLHGGNQTIILGRNVETGLNKSSPNVLYVSRSHVAIKVKGDGKVYLTVIARQERVVSLNDRVLPERMEVEIPIGSRFSLLGSIQWFNYVLMTATQYTELKASLSNNTYQQEEVSSFYAMEGESSIKRKRDESFTGEQVVERDEGSTGEEVAIKKPKIPHVVSSPVPVMASIQSGNDTLPKNVIHGLFHQFDCPICYDTMASVCTLGPCGCNFCYHCIETWYCAKRKNTCPCCNQKFELSKSVSNKRMDTVIRDFMKAMSVPKKDVDSWEDRVLVGIQRRQAYYQLHKPITIAPALPQLMQASVAPNQVQHEVATTAPPQINNNNPPVTREVLSELIRARAIQVIAAASLPEHANNTILQGRAQRAQVVLAQIDSQRQQEQASQ